MASDDVILNSQANIIQQMRAQNATQEDVYAAIIDIRKLMEANLRLSQSAMQDEARSYSDRQENWRPNRSGSRSEGYRGASEEFKKAFKDALGDPFKKEITNGLKDFSKSLGYELKDLPAGLGKQLAGELRGSKFGKMLDSRLTQAGTSMAKGLSQAGADIAANGGKLTAGLGSMAKGVGGAAKALGPLAAGLVAVTAVLDTLTPTLEGLVAVAGSASKAMKRGATEAANNQKLAQDRLIADMQTLIEEPFNILRESAQKVYNAWDSTLAVITGSQGYTKANVQDLMAIYAERLRDEGLADYVAGTDIVENLSKVLSSGLSGQVAEEFAYIATKLNKAVPTEDFFNYAGTYASIAANAISSGMSQADAIEYANKQLEDFASNVLYASRQIAGGFSTGLTNASSLLEDATKIAVAGRTGNVSEISGVLASVSAIVGAVAPDLASNLVSAVTEAALGGNASNLTALRSLAGTGAANTDFLRALASAPKEVFATMFANLGNLQRMSSTNYMEVAEGLSQVFGVSMDAFARVDFAQLASSIMAMEQNNASLAQNMKLLKEGQTTTTAEQLKAQQINTYMIEEGLSYVLDNEAARTIQQHMWDEQLAKDMQEATYGVELVGSTQKLLLGITMTVEKLANLLNPFAWFKGIGNLVVSSKEAKAWQGELQNALTSRNVGSANSAALKQLLATGNASTEGQLNTRTYVELLGGTSNINALRQDLEHWYAISGQAKGNTQIKTWYENLFNPSTWEVGVNADRDAHANRYAAADWILGNDAATASSSGYSDYQIEQIQKQYIDEAKAQAYARTGMTSDTASLGGRHNVSHRIQSMYDWGLVGKSGIYATPATVASPYASISTSSMIQDRTVSNMQKFADSIGEAVSSNMSYEDWLATSSRYGISDVAAAIENLNITEEDLKAAYSQQEAAAASERTYNRQLKEEEFWDASIDYYKEWTDYFINSTTRDTQISDVVAAVKSAERQESQDAVLALATSLASGVSDLTDPTQQQNALLSKILLVCEAIMQQNNSGVGMILPETLTGLGRGLTL